MSRLIIRKPAQPVHHPSIRILADSLRPVEGVAEVHLTEWFDPSQLTHPMQVMVLVLEDHCSEHRAVYSTEKILERLNPELRSFVIIPMYRRDPLLQSVQRCSCLVFSTDQGSPKSRTMSSH